MCLVPYSSNAFDVQGTEYDDPGLLPPDIDFTAYDYYFLTFSGTVDSPIYKLYLVKDNGNSGRLYFSVAKSASDTRYYSGSYTAYDITTNYYVDVAEYNNSTGLWGTPYKASSVSNSSKFVFDNYSTFESTCKYIIGANCNIYSYFGTLVRSGDYDILNLFFLGGLKGSTDKTEQPTETTTTNSSSGGVSDSGIISRLETISDIVRNLAESLSIIIDALSGLKNGTVSSDLTDRLDSIRDLIFDIKSLITDIKGSIFSLSDLTSYLDDKFSDISLNIAKIASDTENLRNNFWEFASLGGHIQKLAELIAHVDTAIQQLDSSLGSSFDTVTDKLNSILNAINNNKLFLDFEDTIKSIQSELHTSKLYLDSINTKIFSDFENVIKSIQSELHTMKLYLDNINTKIFDSFGDLSSKLSDCYSELTNVSYYSKWINNNLVELSKNFLEFCDALFDHLRAIEGYIIDVYNSIGSLPESLEELLKKLFIPTEHDFSEFEELKEKFGFVYQIIDLSNTLFADFESCEVAPVFVFNIDSDLFGSFSFTFDFSCIPSESLSFFRDLVSAISIFVFINRTRRRLPNIIYK